MTSLRVADVPIQPGPTLDARTSWLGRHFWATAGFVLVTGTYLHSRVLLNDDVSWFLWSGRALLHGEKPGIDILDPNPPLAILVYAPAAWLGSLGLGYPLALALWLHLVMAGIAALARCAAPRQDSTILLGLALATWGIGWDFGQRDELVWLLCWPYVLAAGSRADQYPITPTVRVATGLLAAFAICLKPFYLLLPVTLQLWLAWRGGSWRQLLAVDNVMAAAFCAAIVAVIWFVTPDYVRAFPVLSVAYLLFSDTAGTLCFVMLLAVSTLAVAALPDRQAGNSSTGTVHILAAAAALTAFALQGKALSYQTIPAVLWLTIAVSLAVRGEAGGAARSVPQVLTFLPITLMVSLFWSPAAFDGNLPNWPLPRFLHQQSDGGPVFIFGAAMGPTFPAVVYADTEWTGRFGYPMVALAAIALAHQHPSSSDDPSAVKAGFLASYARRTLDEDFVRRPPRLVLVDHRAAEGVVPGTDLLAFQLEDPAFREIWSWYRPIASIPGYDAYRLARSQ